MDADTRATNRPESARRRTRFWLPPAQSSTGLSRGAQAISLVELGALVGLGPRTTDLYLPAQPAVAADLGTSDAAVQLALTATMVGFTVGQFRIGPLSDAVGRRVPLLVPTTLRMGASLGIAIPPDLFWVLVFRALQGFGAAGGSVVAMATVRDPFAGQRLVRMLTRLTPVTGLAPILAPLIGSQMLAVTDWRGLFIVLAMYSTILVVLAAVLIAETLAPDRRRIARHSTAGQRYRALFADRVYVGLLLISGLMFSGMFVYLSSSPFVFQKGYRLDVQQYGLVFAFTSLGFVAGSQTASRLMRACRGRPHPGRVPSPHGACRVRHRAHRLPRHGDRRGRRGRLRLHDQCRLERALHPSHRAGIARRRGGHCGGAVGCDELRLREHCGARRRLLGRRSHRRGLAMGIALTIAVALLWSVVRP